jgi:hypothetical protein
MIHHQQLTHYIGQQQEIARCQTKTNNVFIKVNLKCQKKGEQIDPTCIFITMYQIHYNHLQLDYWSIYNLIMWAFMFQL